jgi:hypothetical protein
MAKFAALVIAFLEDAEETGSTMHLGEACWYARRIAEGRDSLNNFPYIAAILPRIEKEYQL